MSLFFHIEVQITKVTDIVCEHQGCDADILQLDVESLIDA